jgi:hypothetical protein
LRNTCRNIRRVRREDQRHQIALVQGCQRAGKQAIGIGGSHVSSVFLAIIAQKLAERQRQGTRLTATENAVTRWFGAHFDALHPLLQDLHRRGGTLRGSVDIRFGPGLAGWLGRRLAHNLGIPSRSAHVPFEVRITHTRDTLQWDRRFGADHWMPSTFIPIGVWPSGYWIERTGRIALRLTVDVIDGGWHWRCLGARFGRVPIPLWLLPRTRAHKCVRDGKYVFHVGLALPLFGNVLSYEGTLEAVPGAA